MSEQSSVRATFEKTRRRAVPLSADALIHAEPLFTHQALPLVITPAVQGVDLRTWAADHLTFIEAKLREHGGILFRDFGPRTAAALQELVAAIASDPLAYTERSSPRTRISGNVYTSTDYPADQPIFLHNENSYQAVWPMKLFFLCLTPPISGGETPIADTRALYTRLPEEIRRPFEQRGVLYRRNYRDAVGLSWQAAFQTGDREQVEAQCRQSGISVTWTADGLTTTQVRDAVKRHPVTNDPVWFNHATFFHVTTHTPKVRDGLLAEYGEAGLPINSYYGDGGPIAPEVLDELRQAYRDVTVQFPWRTGDLLLLDNMLAAHGRQPFSGERRIAVAMAQPSSGDHASARGQA
jgi:alpha-ketoglutarate-dependent taurine dioxygenase